MVAALAETITTYRHSGYVFADQVTTVAREAGVEGRLGRPSECAPELPMT